MSREPKMTVQQSEQIATSRPEPLSVVPVRHYGRGMLSVVAVIVTLVIGYGFASTPNIDWGYVARFMTDGSILRGLLVTIQLTVISMILSVIIAIAVAAMRMQNSRILQSFAWFYAYVFRAIPLLVLLILVGNVGLFVTEITIGVPFTDIVFYSAPLQRLVNPFVASVIALTLAGSAYMSEVVRGGLLSVDSGQHTAAKALGVNRWNTFRFITWPQALKSIIPPLGNEVIGALKATALVSVIGAGDLLTMAQSIAGQNYRVVDMLMVATVWYFIVVSILSFFQWLLERRFASK